MELEEILDKLTWQEVDSLASCIVKNGVESFIHTFRIYHKHRFEMYTKEIKGEIDGTSTTASNS